MSIFSAVVFNAVLGGYLFAGRFVYERKNIIEMERLFLREMTEKDYDELYMVLSDSDIMQQINGSFIGQWIYAALVWVGAFGCCIAALNYKNQKKKEAANEKGEEDGKENE